jgi:hypothetical protein
MLNSVRRDRKARAIAEVLALIADTHPEFTRGSPHLASETDDCLWEDATAFSAALEKLFAGSIRRKSGKHAARGRSGISVAWGPLTATRSHPLHDFERSSSTGQLPSRTRRHAEGQTKSGAEAFGIINNWPIRVKGSHPGERVWSKR